MYQGIEMKVIMPLFFVLMPVIAIAGGDYYDIDDMNKKIRLEAIQTVLNNPAITQIDKNTFVRLIKEHNEKTTLTDLIEFCSRSVPQNMSVDEKVNVCQNFLEQIISEHNKLIGQYDLPRKSQYIYPVGGKLYSTDEYYMSKTKPDMPGYYGIFTNEGFLRCVLGCGNDINNQELFCTPDSYAATVAFACEPKDESLNEYYTDRFLVSYDAKYNGTSFNFNNAYLPNPIDIDSVNALPAILNRYKDYNNDAKINPVAIDFINCDEFLNKTLVKKTYKYVPETSNLYTTYATYIDDFNNHNVRKGHDKKSNLFGSPREYEDNICKNLTYFYTSALSLEEKMETANARIEKFLEVKTHLINVSNTSMDYGKSTIISTINDIFAITGSSNAFSYAGYIFNYEDNCDETLETLPAERNGTFFGVQIDTLHVQCNIYNTYAKTSIPVFYELRQDTVFDNPAKRNKNTDNLNHATPDEILNLDNKK